MKAITLRNIPRHMARQIERRAREDKTSRNRAVLALLEEGVAGPKPGGPPVVHRDLDFLFGMWSKKEADAFDARLAEQRKIDPELWK